MKMLFVHDRLGAFGGAEANILLTASALKNRGLTTGLLHGDETGQGEAAWIEAFSSFFPLGAKNNKSRVQTALWEFQPDVIYVHKMSDLDVVQQLVEGKVPVVRMVHDHDLYCMRSYKYHYWSRAICARPASPFCVYGCGASIARQRHGPFPIKWVSYLAKRREIRLNQKCRRLIVATRYMKGELLRNNFAGPKIEIIPPVTQHAATPVRSSFSDRNLILFAGQIIRGKGVDVLLEALAHVNAPFECVILGEGNHKSYCQELSVKLGLQDRVHFKGFVPQAEIRNYYRECSVVVLSSVWPEPFGATGLEGMRCGLPVVAFDAGGIREWLIDGCNGFLVPWMDRAAFAARVDALLADKELARKMGENGLGLVNQNYNFAKYITDLERLFLQVVEESREKVCA